MTVVRGLVVTGLPHVLLCPGKNSGWQALRNAFEEARRLIEGDEADLMVLYSTMWPSVIGHQIQARPNPEWVHVDELFHELGSIPYQLRMDADFARSWDEANRARGLTSRTVDYHGFPIDTGSVVALKMLDPDSQLPACIVSSNVYSDRAETVVLGKACRAAIEAGGRRAVVVVVTSLSNRLFTDWIEPEDDHIHSLKDEEWNRKLLQFFGEGRLEDVAQLSRQIGQQVRVRKVVNFKPMWWLSAVMGQHNRYDGAVLGYAPVFGTGGAVVSLTPSASGATDKEYDEEDVEVFTGDRDVLDGVPAAPAVPPVAPSAHVAPVEVVRAPGAPKPVGAYPHARRVGDLLYLSGVGPRQPGTDAIPGGPISDENGFPREYDIAAQTEAVIANVATILEAAGSSLDKVVDVTVFLVDMERDFAGYNAVYAKHFDPIGATRTTLAVSALPTPIAVEFKVIAQP